MRDRLEPIAGPDIRANIEWIMRQINRLATKPLGPTVVEPGDGSLTFRRADGTAVIDMTPERVSVPFRGAQSDLTLVLETNANNIDGEAKARSDYDLALTKNAVQDRIDRKAGDDQLQSNLNAAAKQLADADAAEATARQQGDADGKTYAEQRASLWGTTALNNAKAHADAGDASTLASAKSDATAKADSALASAKSWANAIQVADRAYTDTKAGQAEANAKSAAASDATAKANAAESRANAYTRDYIASIVPTQDPAIGALQRQLNDLQAAFNTHVRDSTK